MKLTIKAKGSKKATTITKRLKKGSRSMKTRKLKLKLRYAFTLVATDAAKNKSKAARLSRTFR